MRHVREDDIDSVVGIYGNAEAMKFFPKVFSREETLIYFIRSAMNRYARDGYAFFAVELQATGEVIGMSGPSLQAGPGGEKMLEVGYHFNPRFWGHGYATEAARRSMQYCFDDLAAPFIVSFINPGNVASQRVAQRNGLRLWTSFDWHGAVHDVWRIEREKFERNRRDELGGETKQ